MDLIFFKVTENDDGIHRNEIPRSGLAVDRRQKTELLLKGVKHAGFSGRFQKLEDLCFIIRGDHQGIVSKAEENKIRVST